MGYTRYWDIKNDLDDYRFLKFKEFCNQIVELFDIPLEDIKNDLDDYRFLKFKEFCNQIVELFDIPLEDIVITDNVVRFNGVDDGAHETFVFSKKSGFNFCKTQRKPYDAVVCACLLTAMDIFGSDISFSSNGDNNDEKVKENLKSLIRDRKLNNIL